jgi:FKBP-type peptidyl-prolyl cis-trans isomerase FklB
MGIADMLFQRNQKKAAENLAAGQAFLTENAQKEGVVTLESGLQYQVLEMGAGEKPQATDQVSCHYHGTLIDGTVFDSSVERGQPASFPLNRVIKGWTEGLQLMPVGSKFRFFIPPHLAYGERAVSAVIGANSTLIFDVELLGIN